MLHGKKSDVESKEAILSSREDVGKKEAPEKETKKEHKYKDHLELISTAHSMTFEELKEALKKLQPLAPLTVSSEFFDANKSYPQTSDKEDLFQVVLKHDALTDANKDELMKELGLLGYDSYYLYLLKSPLVSERYEDGYLSEIVYEFYHTFLTKNKAFYPTLTFDQEVKIWDRLLNISDVSNPLKVSAIVHGSKIFWILKEGERPHRAFEFLLHWERIIKKYELMTDNDADMLKDFIFKSMDSKFLELYKERMLCDKYLPQNIESFIIKRFIENGRDNYIRDILRRKLQNPEELVRFVSLCVKNCLLPMQVKHLFYLVDSELEETHPQKSIFYKMAKLHYLSLELDLKEKKKEYKEPKGEADDSTHFLSVRLPSKMSFFTSRLKTSSRIIHEKIAHEELDEAKLTLNKKLGQFDQVLEKQYGLKQS